MGGASHVTSQLIAITFKASTLVSTCLNSSSYTMFPLISASCTSLNAGWCVFVQVCVSGRVCFSRIKPCNSPLTTWIRSRMETKMPCVFSLSDVSPTLSCQSNHIATASMSFLPTLALATHSVYTFPSVNFTPLHSKLALS